jgi:hypothetical protein
VDSADLGTEQPRAAAPLLDLDALQPSVVHDGPYRWANVGQLLTPEVAADLRAAFPTEDFWPNEGDDGEKTYSFRLRPLLAQGATAVAQLSPLADVWHRLAAELAAPSFREAMGRMLGVDVMDCGVEADFFRFGPSDWMGPHRDLPAKQVSLIVYLNEGWTPSHGGCFRVLRSRDEDDVVAELPPEPGSAALVVRSKRSWHSVTRVVPDAPTDRISFQVLLWRPEHVSSNWTVDPTTGEVSAGRRVYNGSPLRRAVTRLRHVFSRRP